MRRGRRDEARGAHQGVRGDIPVRLPGLHLAAGGAQGGVARRGGAVGGHRHVPAVPRPHRGGLQRGSRLVRLRPAAGQQAPARARPHAATGRGDGEDGAGEEPAERRQAGQGQPRGLHQGGAQVPGADQRGRGPARRCQGQRRSTPL